MKRNEKLSMQIQFSITDYEAEYTTFYFNKKSAFIQNELFNKGNKYEYLLKL